MTKYWIRKKNDLTVPTWQSKSVYQVLLIGENIYPQDTCEVLRDIFRRIVAHLQQQIFLQSFPYAKICHYINQSKKGIRKVFSKCRLHQQTQTYRAKSEKANIHKLKCFNASGDLFFMKYFEQKCKFIFIKTSRYTFAITICRWQRMG